MKQPTLLYALIILGIIFLLIYLNKKVFLEGYTYTYNNNLAYYPGIPSMTNPAPFNDNNKIHESTCKIQCDQTSDCTGFTSNIISGSDQRGTCTLYKYPWNYTNHTPGTNLYLRTGNK
jgi:hypothetical protein